MPTPKAAPRQGEVPVSMAAERQLIGAALLEALPLEPRVPEEVRSAVHGVLSAADFFDRAHQLIWVAIESVWEAGEVVSFVTVSDALSRTQQIDEVDQLLTEPVEQYLLGCVSEAWATSGVSSFARIVHDYAVRRSQIQEASASVLAAYTGKPLERKKGWL